MTTVADVAEPLAGICVPVPWAGEGICLRCHGRPNPGFQLCWSCDNVERQVSRPCELVVPISLYAIPSQLHFVLRHYKSGLRPARQHELSLQVASILCYFLGHHGGCIGWPGGWDVMTTVPSSSGRGGEHPLVRALRRVPNYFSTYDELLGPGTVAVGHNRASDKGFQAKHRFDGERVLLVDDTFTSGARAQSAASVLNNAGAEVVAIVPVGRVITAGHDPEWWEAQKRERFRFEACCLEPF